MKSCGAVSRAAVAAVLGLMCGAPLRAADDTEKSLLIGLGLTAASGKTSLGEGAGAIEAGLLNQEALQQAGAIIAMITNGTLADSSYGSSGILVLTQAETVDFTLPTILTQRFKHITKNLVKACAIKPEPKNAFGFGKLMSEEGSDGAASKEDRPGFWGGSPRGADLFGAAMVDRSITGVTLSTVDRQLVNAILMNKSQPRGAYSLALNSWNAWQNPEVGKAFTGGGLDAGTRAVALSSKNYSVLGEPQIGSEDGDVWKKFVKLRDATDNCTYRESAKGWLEVANTALTSVLTTEKGPSPLSVAGQIESFRALNAADPVKTLILRVAVDHSGGTAISRTGVLYSLGFPNAATVGSGLVASFRLVNPKSGAILRQGLVRCAVDQTNIRRMRPILEHRQHRRSLTQPRAPGEVVCDFKVA